MKQSYMNMSMNDIIKLVEKKDKRIAELEKKLSEVNENIKIVGRENRKLKKNNERYQERLIEVLYKGKIKNCSTCKNNVEFPPPHTCDICTSLDQDEEYGMWEAKESDLDIEKYKVYEIDSKCSYIGTSLVAAKSAEEANEFIEIYREIDKDNKCDSWGYSDVSEEDVIENLWSEESGIIKHGIRYYG